ncbi:hypothetical protein CAPTEDRAFT_217693 [Capitella teleta]|uniref:N-acetyltransferase domain-containing protein n=1 Tax=Capitella teleta TaxID=283909 RepID=X2AMJ5_CAPTE|nr:hypothetical protein CAPTEDRAFT_217693 [Capitella teleta]|eukprot:ELU00310.1 hypothetical protein CAPTEDRAFT_217693 [Capitella teleta]
MDTRKSAIHDPNAPAYVRRMFQLRESGRPRGNKAVYGFSRNLVDWSWTKNKFRMVWVDCYYSSVISTSESEVGLPSFEIDGTSLQMKLMAESDLAVLEQMIETIGWPIYLNDISCHYTINRHGFFGLFSPDGEMMSTMTAFPVGDEMIFISVFIVKEQIRGRGIGTRFLRYIMDINPEKNFALEGAVPAIPLYERMGYKDSGCVLEYLEIPKAYPMKNYTTPSDIR